MIETKKVMIAKIIERKNADPKLVSLFPHFENNNVVNIVFELKVSNAIIITPTQ